MKFENINATKNERKGIRQNNRNKKDRRMM